MAAAKVDRHDLSKLKRAELLEIMLAQSEEIDRLRAELADRERELEDRRIAIERSGSIAEASLRLTKVFEEAQRAADLYLDNVRTRSGDVAGMAGEAMMASDPRAGDDQSQADGEGSPSGPEGSRPHGRHWA